MKNVHMKTCARHHTDELFNYKLSYLTTRKLGCFEGLFCAVWVVMIL